MNSSPYEYRIVEFDTDDGKRFMPQRGFIEGDPIGGPYRWTDGVPEAAPTLELAQAYIGAMWAFDGRRTEGRVIAD